MSVPTQTDEFMQLIEHLRKAQEHSATIGHLRTAEGSLRDKVMGNAWITVSELLKTLIHRVTDMAAGKLS